MMNDIKHYSDEDFQNYLDRNFEGNLNSFEQHIKECSSCADSLDMYFKVWAFAKTEMGSDKLKIDLSSVVAKKIFDKRKQKPYLDYILYGVIFCLSFLSVYWSIQILISNSFNEFIGLLLIPLVFYVILAYKEVNLLQMKYYKMEFQS